MIDPIGVPEEVYRTIAELLRERGYVQLDQPFRWLRSVRVDERLIDVEVDLLAPITPRGGAGHRHERIGGEPLARRTEGAELVRAAFVDHEIAVLLPDGRSNRVSVRVATPSALVILKALAMGQRDKPKDAYDIDYVLAHIGIEDVAAGIRNVTETEIVTKAVGILAEEVELDRRYRARERRHVPEGAAREPGGRSGPGAGLSRASTSSCGASGPPPRRSLRVSAGRPLDASVPRDRPAA